jgi:hypothetical protein
MVFYINNYNILLEITLSFTSLPGLSILKYHNKKASIFNLYDLSTSTEHDLPLTAALYTLN